ncbi:MAG: hypothetical protein ACOC1F_08655 [Myxococcota bacterium]
MSSSVWKDDDGIVWMRQEKGATADDVRAHMDELARLLNDCDRRLVAVDVRGAPVMMPSEAREAIVRSQTAARIDKQAFIVTNAVARMLAKTILRVSGAKHPVSFVRDDQEAVRWLLEG